MQSTEQALFHRRFSPLKLGQELGQNRSLARVWKRGISLWLPGASSGTSGPPAALQPGPTLPLQCPHLLFLLAPPAMGNQHYMFQILCMRLLGLVPTL